MALELERALGYEFKNKELLTQALTHKSYANERQTPDNERLEFLGDTILALSISDYLMERFPQMSEGMLSKFRAVLVSEAGLSRVARNLKLGSFILIGKGEHSTGGREKSSILSNVMEALFAAVYLDSVDSKAKGLQAAAKVIIGLFDGFIAESENSFAYDDVKTDLQEWIQKRNLGSIEYKVVEEFGPDHDKTFVIALLLDGGERGRGEGKNKKAAEQQAAYQALESLKNI